MDKEKNTEAVSEENIYCLNGRVPVKKAIPFGLQHVLAMFVSNLAPVLIVCSAAFVRGSENHLSPAEITQLLQCAMFAAGIGTCLQLYPVWKIGSRLPIVMGVSFTFLGSLLMICTNPELGYEGMVGAVIAGGIFEGLVGMSAKYWKRFLTPVVSACVVIAIGLSLLSVGMDSWGGGNGAEDFGAWYHLLVGFFTLVVCLAARYLLKGVYKNLNVLVGLVCGYLLSIIFTVAGIAPMVDFSSAGSKPEQDFAGLGVELKTIPVDSLGRPLETTFVCVAPLTGNSGVTWETSHVRHKLKRVLWIPVEGERSIPLAQRRVGSPLLWSPNEEEDRQLREDWEELMDMIVLGQVERITARHGEYLQIRPKAANAKALTEAIGARGERILTLPRGFYLKKNFTSALLARHFLIQ